MGKFAVDMRIIMPFAEPLFFGLPLTLLCDKLYACHLPPPFVGRWLSSFAGDAGGMEMPSSERAFMA